MNGGYWTLPLLFIGLFFILIRRKRKDLLLFSFLLAIYFMIHLAILSVGRPERSLAASAHVFYPLIAIGLINIPFLLSFIFKLNRTYKNYFKYIFIFLFIILVFSFNFNLAHSQLKDAYRGITRVTPTQYKVAEAIKESSMPINANITNLGTLTMQKVRWLRYIAWRYIYPYQGSLNASPKPTYVMIDYSDLSLLQGIPQYKKELDNLIEFEKNLNRTLVYNRNNIRVYKLED
jgi:hypothetical protein